MNSEIVIDEWCPCAHGRVGVARLGWLALCATLPASALDVPLMSEAARPPSVFEYTVVNTYPHDREAFTQGLIVRDGLLFESTGLNGRSSLRKVELASGKVLHKLDVDPLYFAEGLTAWDNQLIQITWQSQTGFVYDLASFKQKRTFAYTGERWGMTHDGKRLIMSDGSANLRFLDPKTFAETGHVQVTYQGQPLGQLNELEFVKGQVFANVWGTPHVVIIDPLSGRVTGQIDFSKLLSAADRTPPVDVLNGIAYDARHDRLFVTGKLWPKLFEVRLEPVGASKH